MSQNTTLISPQEAADSRRWHRLDAKGQVLGRLATKAATLLRGKHKPSYTDHVDCGDHVIITNASQIRLTGHKLAQKFYFSHSGWAGGKKITPLSRQMEKDPTKVVILAIKRMIRNNRLRGKQLARLDVFAGEEPGPKAAAKAV